jgi:hypothetical protein
MNKINFLVTDYIVVKNEHSNKLTLNGQKLPRPSKRITLNQAGIKILSAKIIFHHKKGDIEFEVSRINKIKSFGETRIHTNNILYPGNYTVEIEYRGELNEESLKSQSRN